MSAFADNLSTHVDPSRLESTGCADTTEKDSNDTSPKPAEKPNRRSPVAPRQLKGFLERELAPTSTQRRNHDLRRLARRPTAVDARVVLRRVEHREQTEVQLRVHVLDHPAHIVAPDPIEAQQPLVETLALERRRKMDGHRWHPSASAVTGHNKSLNRTATEATCVHATHPDWRTRESPNYMHT